MLNINKNDGLNLYTMKIMLMNSTILTNFMVYN